MPAFLDKSSGSVRVIWRDVVVFIASLLLAFAIWLIHNLSLYYTRTVRIPVIALCEIEGHAPQSSNAAFLEARCRITGFSIIRMGQGSNTRTAKVEFAQGDLHHVDGDNYFVTASELNAYVPQLMGADAHLDAFISDTLYFRFPSENHKKVPVQPVYKIDFEPQYTAVGPLKVVPDSVVVYGEPYHLDKIDKVYTQPFSLTGLSDGASGSVSLENIKGVRISEEDVSYSMEVARFVEIRLQMPITGRNVPTDRQLLIHPSTATVSFKCAFPVKVDPEHDVRFFIEYKDFVNSLAGKCIPRVSSLPEGILGYTMTPEVFECVESVR